MIRNMGRSLLRLLACVFRLRIIQFLIAATIFALFSTSSIKLFGKSVRELRFQKEGIEHINAHSISPLTPPFSGPKNDRLSPGGYFLVRKPFNTETGAEQAPNVNGGHNGDELISEQKPDPWDNVQQRRRQLVKNVCDAYADNFTTHFNRDSFRHILVDDERKILYCAIPKAACTNWKRFLAFLTGKTNQTSASYVPSRSVHNRRRLAKYGLVYLDNFRSKDIMYRLEHYFKFMMVRHPLERILSAYRDKFIQRNKWTKYFQRKYGSRIVEMYRKQPNATSLTLGNDVTFNEFVKYLFDPATAKVDQLNPHWNHYYKLCHPCHIKYDVIGHFETFDTDTSYILKKISKDNIAFPRNSASNSTVLLYKKTIEALPPSDFSNLVKLYFLDFKLFGYDVPQNRDS